MAVDDDAGHGGLGSGGSSAVGEAAGGETARGEAALNDHRLALEEARLHWSRGDADIAICALKTLKVRICPDSAVGGAAGAEAQRRALSVLQRDVLQLLGEWVAYTRSGGSDEVDVSL
jgi:hypothetical protein